MELRIVHLQPKLGAIQEIADDAFKLGQFTI